MTTEEIEAIKTRLAKVSSGPWKSFIEGRDHTSGSNFIMVGTDEDRVSDIELIGATNDDQDFIAAARQDIPRLIQEIERLWKLVKE